MNDVEILVAGGDLRQIYAYKILSKHYKTVKFALTNDNIKIDKLKKYDVLVLPTVITTDGVHLNAPFCNEKIEISELANVVKSGGVVIGGKFNEDEREIFNEKFTIVEYPDRNDFAIRNAIPTAEGALQVAMEELPCVINGLKTLVLGYGRVGKVVAETFRSAGAKVCVAARKSEDLALCQAMKIEKKKILQALKHPQDFELIINTIPHLVVDKKVLDRINKNCLVIDLASKPGGVDFAYAKQIGVQVVWALSLPPEVTAAKLFSVDCVQ